jgi:hypothetical protein
MFCEPLAGWRHVAVRERRTQVDWAQAMAHCLRTRYPLAEKVILVCDNLNTHTKGACYETFEPATARSLTRLSARGHTAASVSRGAWSQNSRNQSLNNSTKRSGGSGRPK